MWSVFGLAVGVFIYFFSKYFVLNPAAAGEGKWLIPGLEWLSGSPLPGMAATVVGWFLPIVWLLLLGVKLVNANREARGREPLIRIRHAKPLLIVGAMVYAVCLAAPGIFTFNPAEAGHGPYYLPGFSWIYYCVPMYFSNAYGLYYLLYFSAITVFGLYWAVRAKHRLIWRRNLTIIATQWTLIWVGDHSELVKSDVVWTRTAAQV